MHWQDEWTWIVQTDRHMMLGMDDDCLTPWQVLGWRGFL
jgi:hypothetical protein